MNFLKGMFFVAFVLVVLLPFGDIAQSEVDTDQEIIRRTAKSRLGSIKIQEESSLKN